MGRLEMSWDKKIWTPCRLGERFNYMSLGQEKTGWLLSVSADWQGGHGDHTAVRSNTTLLKGGGKDNVQLGLGPRPWTNCWTFEPKICITPPPWIWEFDGFPADRLGLELYKRNGTPRKVRLRSVGISYGRAVYNLGVKDMPPLELESIPLLDPYFAPVWPRETLKQPIGYWIFDFTEKEQKQ